MIHSTHLRKVKVHKIKVAILIIFIDMLFLPTFTTFEKGEDNTFYVSVDGLYVGSVESEEEGKRLLTEARRHIASGSEELVLMDADISFESSNELYGSLDRKSKVVASMENVLKTHTKETLKRAYTVKIDSFIINLASMNDVVALLQSALNRYDTENKYTAELLLDPYRELNVFTTNILSQTEVEEAHKEIDPLAGAGVFATLEKAYKTAKPEKELDFEDYELGLVELKFGDRVEVVESYILEDQITDLNTAIDLVTKEQEKQQVYEVVSGDTLSGIALNNDLTIEKLLEMNTGLEDENSTIRIGDELIITVPEPELSVERKEELYYEEDYEADIIYVDNDEWYTTDMVTRQEPSAGHRKVVAVVAYRNEIETDRELIKEEVTYQAVPKIVERGTKIPPSYIKPISGGRMTSGFGRRKAPTKGASSYHKGIDWATPVGTAVMASSGGKVIKAGWGRGYGYVVYIQHPDGKVTRYGHLSKILVSAGQSVSQGQKIALSGNTGVSTGPHVHFEILINGSQVNPLNYLN